MSSMPSSRASARVRSMVSSARSSSSPARRTTRAAVRSARSAARGRTTAADRRPVLAGPVPAPDAADLVDRRALDHVAGGGHRDREPDRAVRGLDAVAVAPAVLVVLDVVVEDEDVRLLDLVEVPAPGNVGRLDDGELQAQRSYPRARGPRNRGTSRLQPAVGTLASGGRSTAGSRPRARRAGGSGRGHPRERLPQHRGVRRRLHSGPEAGEGRRHVRVASLARRPCPSGIAREAARDRPDGASRRPGGAPPKRRASGVSRSASSSRSPAAVERGLLGDEGDQARVGARGEGRCG